MSWKYNPFTGQLDRVDPSLWAHVSDTVTASATKVVDTVALADFKSIEYFVNVNNDANDKSKSFTLRVVNLNTSLKDSLFGKIGSASMAIDAIINGGNMDIEITNNEIFDLGVSLTKRTV